MNTRDFDPEEFLNLSKNPDHIEGIYNYCDRWCERCTMGKHCQNYEGNMLFSSMNESKDPDKENHEFWNELGKTMENTIRLVHHVAEKSGIDLNAVMQDEEVQKDFQCRSERKKRAMSHPMVKKALKYTRDVDHILFKDNDWLEKKSKEWNKLIELGIDEHSFLKEHHIVKDALEIIQWYSPQIMVKLTRGLGADAEHEIWCDENGFPRDYDGSVKVALIGIDRSMLAWTKVMEVFKEKSDSILDFLVLLEQMKNAAETAFPNARVFKRPGFDD